MARSAMFEDGSCLEIRKFCFLGFFSVHFAKDPTSPCSATQPTLLVSVTTECAIDG